MATAIMPKAMVLPSISRAARIGAGCADRLVIGVLVIYLFTTARR
jgi:hypothetical protein